MRSVSPFVHALRRRTALVLLGLTAALPTSALAHTADIGWSNAEWPNADAEAFIKPIEAADGEGLGSESSGPGMLRHAVLRDTPSSTAFMESPLRLVGNYRVDRCRPQVAPTGSPPRLAA